MSKRANDISTSHFKNAKLSIVVPVFNEAERINENLALLLSEVEPVFPRLEVIVVSDGSTDGTSSRLKSFRHPLLQTIIFEKNVGKGNAIRSGFEKASGDYILFIDGGMEIHPREIRIFVGLMSLYECDIVIGSKRHPQSQVDYSWYRRVLSGMFQFIVRQLFHVNITDSQVGIKLFRREVIQAVLPYLEIDRYGFDLEVLTLARAAGYKRVLEAPIRLDYFNKNNRFIVSELWHVFKVGFSLLIDTWKLYRRLQTIQMAPPRVSTERKAG